LKTLSKIFSTKDKIKKIKLYFLNFSRWSVRH